MNADMIQILEFTLYITNLLRTEILVNDQVINHASTFHNNSITIHPESCRQQFIFQLTKESKLSEL